MIDATHRLIEATEYGQGHLHGIEVDMAFTVRLDSALELALERHCNALRVTKRQVLQKSLATYLLSAASGVTIKSASRPVSPSRSLNFRAFAAAGLVGAIAEGSGAGKARVREHVAARARTPTRHGR